MSGGQQYGRGGQYEYEDRWGFYWAWLIPAMVALMTTLCFFIAWGLAARPRTAATTSGQVAAVVVAPTAAPAVAPTAAPAVAPTAAPAVAPTAPAVATAPPAVVIPAPSFNTPPGELIGGPVTLSGTGTPGTRVRVAIDDVDVGTAVVGADGTWELDTIISDGERTVVVGVLDDAGEVVAASDPVSFTVAGGLGVTLDAPEEGAVLEPGVNTISGTGKAGTALEILDGDLVLDTVTVGATGAWSAQVDLPDGSASISVREAGSDNILARPVRVQVGAAAAVAAGCGDELKIECPAWVTRSGGLTLRMRATPAITADNVITRLPIGTGMTIAEGPETADGFTWWRAVTRGGNEGWVSGENLVAEPD